jgi:hypothetical protein
LEDQEQMITFLKRKGQDQTEAYIDLEEKLAAILKASRCSDKSSIIAINFNDSITISIPMMSQGIFAHGIARAHVYTFLGEIMCQKIIF